MQLLLAWKESLSLLLPPHNKLFFLVALKTTMRTYVILMKHFSWFFISLILFDIIYAAPHIPGFIFIGPFTVSFSFVDWLRMVSWYGFLFLIYLSVRPSVLPKSWGYFFSYIKHFLLFLGIACISSFINYLLIFVLYGQSPVHMYDLGMSFIFTFCALFLLDARPTFMNTFYAFLKACKMFVYNFPLCFVLGALFMIVFRSLALVDTALVSMIVTKSSLISSQQLAVEFSERLMYWFLLPIPISFITVVYVKKIHEQFGFYF